MSAERCRECGAQLRLRSTLCPLCGTGDETDGRVPAKGRPSATASRPLGDHTDDARAEVVTVDDYQADMRRLREELKRLRDAEAS